HRPDTPAAREPTGRRARWSEARRSWFRDRTPESVWERTVGKRPRRRTLRRQELLGREAAVVTASDANWGPGAAVSGRGGGSACLLPSAVRGRVVTVLCRCRPKTPGRC